MIGLRYILSAPRSPAALDPTDRPIIFGNFASGQQAVTLWVSDLSQMIVDEGHRACLIGTIVDRVSGTKKGAAALVSSLNIDDPQDCARHLIENYWGAYLLVVSTAAGCYLLRSPMGQLPCYHVAGRTHHHFSSDARLLAKAPLPPLAIDWRALAAHLRWPDRRSTETCLEGLSECAPGSLLRIDRDIRVEGSFWSPWSFARRSVGEAEAVRPSDLRDIVCAAVGAWAQDEPHVVVPASGGLDSSIVCAALSALGKPFTAVTMATTDPSGDERAYVRHMAQYLDAPVVERLFDTQSIDLAQSASSHLPRPTRKPFMQQTESVMREVAAATGARLVLDGNGGDNVFCYLHSSLPVVDRLKNEGFGGGALRTLTDICQLTQADALTVARMVLRHLGGRGATRGARPDDRLLSREASSLPPPAALTPYLPAADGQLPGTCAHIDLLLRIQNHVDGYAADRGVALVSPLLSQPIVEYCLSVPTWRWCEGGINRAFARQAFRDDLPASIIDRVSKAGPDSFIIHLFRENRANLRDLLLGGLLAANGLIDAGAVAAAIEDPATLANDGVLRLLDLSEAEAWARSWRSA